MTSWQCTAELKKHLLSLSLSMVPKRLLVVINVPIHRWTVHHPSSHLTDNTNQHNILVDAKALIRGLLSHQVFTKLQHL